MDNMVAEGTEGGKWGGTMVLPDGATMAWSGEYLEVLKPERVVLAFTVDAELSAGYETFTVTFDEVDGKTEMVLRQTGGHLSDEEYLRAQHGTGGFMDVLAEHLATLV